MQSRALSGFMEPLLLLWVLELELRGQRVLMGLNPEEDPASVNTKSNTEDAFSWDAWKGRKDNGIDKG